MKLFDFSNETAWLYTGPKNGLNAFNRLNDISNNSNEIELKFNRNQLATCSFFKGFFSTLDLTKYNITITGTRTTINEYDLFKKLQQGI